MLELNKERIARSLISIVGPNGQIICSGFFIDPNGTALTCYHTIAKLSSIQVIDSEGNEHCAIMDKYYSSPQNDIAVLRIQHPSPSFLLFPDDNDYYNTVFTQNAQNNKGISINLKAHNNSSRPGRFKGILNGAPLIISDSITVVGLINSKGNALYFDESKTPNFELLRISLANKYYFEKFTGRKSKLKNLFNLQVTSSINKLIDNGQYLHNNYCLRKNYTSIINDFINGEYYILPILGEAGIGKTTLIAASVSDYIKTYYVLFLSAHNFKLSPKALKDEIKRALGKTLEDNPQPDITLDDLMEILHLNFSKCLIIIDGLDQISQHSSEEITLWLERSLLWARSKRLQVIITANNSFWEAHTRQLDLKSVYKKERKKRHGLLIKGFSSKQTRQAISLYKLPESLNNIPRFNHPFLLRLLYEVSAGEKIINTPPDDYQLLSDYIASKCGRISKIINTKPQIVNSLLLKLGKELSSNNNYWLSYETFANILHDHPDLESALIQENIFIKSSTGLRIAFTWIGNFLISETLDLNVNEINWQYHLQSANAFPIKAIPWLFAKQTFLQQDISYGLKQLLLYITADLPERDIAIGIFTDIVKHISNPDKYYSIIEDFIRAGQTRFFPPDLVGPLVYNSHLSFTNQLSLIKISMASEDLSDWPLGCFIGHHYNYYISTYFRTKKLSATKKILYKYLLNEPEKTMLVLAQWLYVTSEITIPQKENDYSIYKVACGIIYQFRKFNFNLSCEILAKYPDIEDKEVASMCESALFEIAENDQSETTKLILKWHSEKKHTTALLCLCSAFYWQYGFHDYKNKINPILLDIAKHASSDMDKLSAMRMLVNIPEYTTEMIYLILQFLKENRIKKDFSHGLHAWVGVDEYFDIIVPELVLYIKNGSDNAIRIDCITSLFNFRCNDHNKLTLARHLEYLINEIPELLYEFSLQLDTALGEFDFESEGYKILISLVPQVLDKENDKARLILFQYLCNYEECAKKKSEKLRLINWAFNKLTHHALSELCPILIKSSIYMEEEKMISLIKPTLIWSLKSSNNLINNILEESLEKNVFLFHDLINDKELIV